MRRHVAILALLAVACENSAAPSAPDGSPNDTPTDATAFTDGDASAVDGSLADGSSLDALAPDVAVVDRPPTDAPPGDAPVLDSPVVDGSIADAPAADASMVDALSPTDIPGDGPGPAPSCSRPLYPLSGARVTARRPTLRFVRASGARETLVEVCRERDCRAPLLSTSTADDSLSPSADLAPGVYFWRLTPRGADVGACTSATWQFTVSAPSPAPASSWGTSLDLNGDGYGDLAVATVDASWTSGEVRVYHGSSGGLGATPVTVISGLPVRAAVFQDAPVPVSAGDLNGDGFVDLAVGLATANEAGGEVRVYLGSPTGVSSREDATLGGPDGRFGRFGTSLAGVGDLDGDGFGDLVVGAPRANVVTATGDGVPGKVYTFHGLPTGIRSAPTTTIVGPGGARGEFGHSIAGAGDVNADRFADVIVGARGAGQAYVFRGGALGLATVPIATLGNTKLRSYGEVVACAGDIDGDGRADVAVLGAISESRVFVRLAGRDGMFSGADVVVPTPSVPQSVVPVDINTDGFTDLAVGLPGPESTLVFLGAATGLSATPTFTLPMGGAFGASLGDANRDGASDLAIAGFRAPVRVYHGSASGPPALARAITTMGLVDGLGAAWGGI